MHCVHISNDYLTHSYKKKVKYIIERCYVIVLVVPKAQNSTYPHSAYQMLAPVHRCPYYTIS